MKRESGESPEQSRCCKFRKRCINTSFTELTAAGLFGTFTRFPFHPLLRIENAKQNVGKDRNIYNKSINLTTVSSKKHSLFYKKHNLTPFCEKVTDERKNGHIYKSIMLP